MKADRSRRPVSRIADYRLELNELDSLGPVDLPQRPLDGLIGVPFGAEVDRLLDEPRAPPASKDPLQAPGRLRRQLDLDRDRPLAGDYHEVRPMQRRAVDLRPADDGRVERPSRQELGEHDLSRAYVRLSAPLALDP